MPALEASPLAWEANSATYRKAFEELNGNDQKDSPKEDDVLAYVNT
jgi:hypothetical protein